MSTLVLVLVAGCVVGLACFVLFARERAPASQEENEPEENAGATHEGRGDSSDSGSPGGDGS